MEVVRRADMNLEGNYHISIACCVISQLRNIIIIIAIPMLMTHEFLGTSTAADEGSNWRPINT